MGEVYRVEDLTLTQEVALKFLPAPVSRSPERRERLLSEVRAARQVSHPNVCRVYDTGETDGELFLSMEYIDGEDLASLLRRIGRLPPDKAIGVARQLCAGLAAAHAKGVLHRDLKPANVMIDGEGNGVITDFGLAGLAQQPDDHVAGTPAYMAPELFSGRPASVKSDVYALGLVLYELFGGRPAFQAASVSELARHHQESSPTALAAVVPDIDRAIERTVLRCLAKEPSERPASALDVSAALPGGDPLAAALARGETPSPQTVAAAGAHIGIRPAVGLACVVGVLAGLSAAVFLSGRTQLTSLVPLDKPPAVLEARARELIAGLGYTGVSAYTSSGFMEAPYVFWIRDHDRSPTRWQGLRSGTPAGLLFWFRQSPRPLAPTSVDRAGKVAPHEPPAVLPGMATVVLNPGGALHLFTAVPERTVTADNGSAYDWTALLQQAGFDPAGLTPATPRILPPVYASQRAAWDGVYPTRRDITVHIEAAAAVGRPVYFEVFEPWSTLPLMDAIGSEVVPATLPGMLLQGLLLVGAVLLAWRHVRLGRGDRTGAFRLAAFLFAAHVAASLLSAEGLTPLIVFAIAARGLLLGGLAWLLYVALEPFLRRRWPAAMISWSRLLAGRVQDPLVGRDLLAGVCAGVLLNVLDQLRMISPAWLGLPPDIETAAVLNGSSIGFLRGLRFTVAALFNYAVLTVPLAMSLVLIFFLLTIVLRKRWLAAVSFTLLLSIQALTSSGSAALFTPLLYVVVSFVLLRFGLLAMMTAGYLAPVLSHQPLTLDTGVWFAGSSWLVLGFVVALAVYGLRHALAGRPVLSGALLNE